MDGMKTERNARQVMRVEEVAHALDVSRTAAYELIASGRLGAIRVGRKLRVTTDEFERFLASNGAAAA